MQRVEPPTADRVLARLDDFDGLIGVLRARRIAMGLSQLALEDKAGLTGGYVGKLEGSVGKPNSRSIGRESLPLLLGALGLRLAVVDGVAGIASVAGHRPQRQAGQGVAGLRDTNFMREIGQRGAWKTNARLNARQRQANGRKGAKVRWRKWREAKAEKERREKRKARQEAGTAKEKPGDDAGR